MRMYDIISHKKQNMALSNEEILFFVDGFTKGEIPDYQAAALLMAICLNGMDENETAILTHVMAVSGDMADLSSIPGIKVDKHSTGGVGDKTSLIIGPIVAACGVPVAKMSGRGLGHSGGTVDKLESIPGLQMAIEPEKMNAIAELLSERNADLYSTMNGKVYGLLPYEWYEVDYASELANAFFIGKVLYNERFSDINQVEMTDYIYTMFYGVPLFDKMNIWLERKAYQKITK